MFLSLSVQFLGISMKEMQSNPFLFVRLAATEIADEISTVNNTQSLNRNHSNTSLLASLFILYAS